MRTLSCLIVCLCVFTCGTRAVIAEDKIDFEITADYFSKYIFRGQNLSDDPVFQPGLSASYKGLTAAIWGNMDLRNINGNSGDFSEMDYSLDYSSTFSGNLHRERNRKCKVLQFALVGSPVILVVRPTAPSQARTDFHSDRYIRPKFSNPFDTVPKCQ